MNMDTVFKISLRRGNIWSDGYLIRDFVSGDSYGYATEDIIEIQMKEGLLCIYCSEGFCIKHELYLHQFENLFEGNKIIFYNFPEEQEPQKVELQILEETQDKNIMKAKYQEYNYQKSKCTLEMNN